VEANFGGTPPHTPARLGDRWEERPVGAPAGNQRLALARRILGVDGSGQIPGVFAVGDVVDDIYRLPITAAASGCSVAIDAEHYLQEGKT
jgi:hypothetical protein